MATRVNKKFVIILTSALVVVFLAVASIGFYALSTRNQRNMDRGNAAFEQGEFYEAKIYYGKAVNKDATNVEWLQKFHDALLQSIPPTTAEYDKFYDDHINTMSRMAQLFESDIDHQIGYIAERNRSFRRTAASMASFRAFENLVEQSARYIRSDEPKLVKLMRYRALSVVDRMGSEVVEPEDRAQALADLEAAVAFDPDDHESALAIARWHFAEMERNRRNALNTEATLKFEDGMEVLDEFLAENPDSPDGHLLKLTREYFEANRQAVSPASQAQLRQRYTQRVSDVIDVFERVDITTIRPESLNALASMVSFVRDVPLEKMIALADEAIRNNPNDMRLLMLKGGLLMQNNDFEASLATYQKIVDMPLPPVSLEGKLLPYYQAQALGRQVDVALGQYSLATDPAKRDEALALAKSYRDALESKVGVRGKEELQLRDAKLAIVNEDYNVAVANLSEIIKLDVGDAVQNHRLLAHALREQGNLGEARNVMVDLLKIMPNDPQLLVEIAEYDINLSDFEKARDRLELALEGNPSSEMIQQRLREVETALDPESPDADPIVSAVIMSRNLRDDQNYPEAERVLKEQLERHPNEYRLVRELAEVLVRQDRRPEALEYIDSALVRYPDNDRLKQVRLVVAEKDPVTLGIQLVDLSDASEVDKLIDKYQVYGRHGQQEKADEMLAQAQEMNRLHPRVIELEFLLALVSMDKAAAQAAIERATQANADQLGGLLYQARMNMRFDNTGDPNLTIAKAITYLQQAAEKSPRNPAVWLLLGEARTQAGQVAEAVEAYKKAYEGRPNDAQTIKAYARALERINEEAEALKLITPSAGIVRQTMSDPEIVEMWLRLAETHGDRKEVLRIRRELFAAEPKVFNYRNAIDHFRLQIEEEEWDSAQEVIDRLSSLGDLTELQMTILQVNLIRERDGFDASKAEFERYVASLDESTDKLDKLRAYLNFGQFLVENDRPEEGVAVFEAATPFQTEMLEVERQLGDLYFRLGNRQTDLSEAARASRDENLAAEHQGNAEALLTEAADHYDRIISEGQAEGNASVVVYKRYAETLLKLGKVDEAKQALTNVPQTQGDLELLVLRASIAAASGNRRGARELYDEAVERFPSRTLPYVQRALFNASDAALRADAIEDLRKAVILNPNLIQAWTELYRLMKLANPDNLDAAFATLQEAIRANPREDRLVILLIQEQFAAGRREDGVITATQAIQSRPDDKNWLYAVAQILGQAGRHRDAADLFQRLVSLTPEGEQPESSHIAGLLDATLKRTDARIPDSRIFDLLRQFRVMVEGKTAGEGLTDQEKVYFPMLEARALAKVKDLDGAFEPLKKALAETGESGPLGAAWFGQLQLMTERREETYTFLKQQEARGQLNPFLVVQLQNYLRNEGSAVEPLLKRVNEVLAGNPDPLTRLDALKNKSRFLYDLGRFEECAEVIKQALQITPFDVELNNNIAYIYVENLQRYDEAVEYAELARARDEFSANTLDTLGWAYYHVDRLDEAREVLKRAYDQASTDAERIPAQIHLGFVELKSGDRNAARQAYDQALRLAETSRGVAEAFRDKFDALRKALEGP